VRVRRIRIDLIRPTERMRFSLSLRVRQSRAALHPQKEGHPPSLEPPQNAKCFALQGRGGQGVVRARARARVCVSAA
jgi:hypothetical protein